jgi:hypothetical protein
MPRKIFRHPDTFKFKPYFRCPSTDMWFAVFAYLTEIVRWQEFGPKLSTDSLDICKQSIIRKFEAGD